MNAKDIENDRELQQVLWACYDFWEASQRPIHEREIFYGWIRRRYEERFGTGFHQSKLRQLASLGYLERRDTARGGSRRYYRLANPAQTREFLTRWGLLD